MKADKTSCWQCAYFAVSWDKNFRYKCNKIGFKSQSLPSTEVKKIDGRDCLHFKRKADK